MNALRATLLTWRIRRFESVLAAVSMLAAAVSAWVVGQRLYALSIPAGCWEVVDAFDTSPICAQLTRAFFDIRGNEGGHVRTGLIVVPTLTGLILGTVLVARELELRTAPLAWSLDGGRLRWLVERSGAALLLMGVGLGAMAWMGSGFESASQPLGDMDRIGELASRGLPLVSRGLAALGIALLAGAVLGRMLPALLVATVAVGVLWYVGSGIVPKVVAASFAAWIDDAQRREGDFVHVVRYGEFDPRQPGRRGEPGARIGSGEAYRKGLIVVCGPTPPRVRDGSEYDQCRDAFDQSTVYGWWLAVPASALPVIEGAEVGLDLAILGGTVAATAVLVRRRRPG